MFHRGGKRPEIVASFQAGHNAAFTMGLSNGPHNTSQFAVPLVRDRHTRQRVIPVSIESCRNQHELRLKRRRRRNQHVVKKFLDIHLFPAHHTVAR